MPAVSMALESLRVQLQAFWSTISGTEAPDLSSVVCHDGGQTSFYLELDKFIWNNSNNADACEGTDLQVVLILVVIIHTISWTGRWGFWEPLARAIRPDLSREDQRRFSTCMTECSFFCASGVAAYRILSPKPWLYQPVEWNSYLTTSNYLWLETDFKCYYLLYMARFISDSLSLPFELRRKDVLLTSLIHHIVTLGLVYGSAVQGLTRMGGVIMFFFDWADPPLLTAKSLKYLSRSSNDVFQKIANRLFELFAVVFILTRNVLYNYVCYVGVRDLPEWATACRVLLVALAVMQTYWLYLLLQVVQRQLQTGTVSDVREDDNGDGHLKPKTN